MSENSPGIPEYLDIPGDGYYRAYDFDTGLTCVIPASMTSYVTGGGITIDGGGQGAMYVHDVSELYDNLVTRGGASEEVMFETYRATCVAELQIQTGAFDIYNYAYQEITGENTVKRVGFDMMIRDEEWHGYAVVSRSKYDGSKYYGFIVARRTADDAARLAFNEIISTVTIAPPAYG